MNLLDKDNLPEHIGIIMDGNGRWAKKRNLNRSKGHEAGMKKVIEVVELANELGINYLTLYAFSTENWKRPKLEVNALMNLLVVFIDKELSRLAGNNVRVKVLGDISKLPKVSQNAVLKAIKTTKDNTGLTLNIALNYGGRDEIIYGIKSFIKDYESGGKTLEDLDEESFKEYLYTKGQPDPDLIIRPSGEHRVSNFMTYQMAYSELYFSNVLWPDFSEEDFIEAILDYQNRNRRFGGL